jgi:uncharacterized membrane protein YhdT
MTGTDLCVKKPHSVPVIFEPPCIYLPLLLNVLASVWCCKMHNNVDETEL